MENGKDQNEILLRGRVTGEPVYSHSSHGERFYQFPLTVTRLSGTEDVVNVQLPQLLWESCRPAAGDRVEVTGSLRTFNNHSGVGSRLVITVLAADLTPSEEAPANRLLLRGTVCRRSEVRRTPLGREICDFTMAVNRRYGRADYLPCIAWGSVAQRCAQLPVGSRLILDGRLQSREYVKQLPEGSQRRVAYEVSAMGVTLES